MHTGCKWALALMALVIVLSGNLYADESIKHRLSNTGNLQPFAYPVDFHAYLDSSYNYLVNKNKFTSGSFNRLFDIEENGFTLNQFGFYVQEMPPQGWGGRLRVLGGADANRSAPSGWNPYLGSQTLAMYPYEAYLQYSFPKLSLLGGILDSIMGLESDESAEDLNFSRSILAYAQPGTYVGLRAIYHWDDAVDLYAGLGNGLSTVRQAGQLGMVDLAASYTPSKKVMIALHGSNGPNYVVPGMFVGQQSRFSLLDLVGSYKVTQQLRLEVNADYYKQQKGQMPTNQDATVVWEGIAGYASYRFNDKWRLAARGEVFSDGDGFTFGVRQTWREATLTLQYMPREDVILRAETRRDFSNVNSFVNPNGIGSTDYQQSFAVEGIYLIL